jgi:leucyl-tRNA synthetase
MILGTSAFVFVILLQARAKVSDSFLTGSILSVDNKEKVMAGVKAPTSLVISEEIFNSIKLNGNHILVDEWVKNNNRLKNFEIHYSAENVIKTSVDISLLIGNSNVIDKDKLRRWMPQYKDIPFLEEEEYVVIREVEKMSKSKYNVVTPDDICEEYGADTLRLYEMFLGPLEQAKPWNTAGISGVFGFLKKLCRLYFDEHHLIVTDEVPTKDNLKTLHKTIKKVADDIENFSFNTSVSQFMICVNELSTQGCHSRAILEPLAIVISPYAPHIAEELWSLLGNEGSIALVPFPVFEPKHLIESSKEYPVSFNGKMRFTIKLPLDLSRDQIEEIIMKDERTIKQLDGKTPNKVIIVPGKIINLVG